MPETAIPTNKNTKIPKNTVLILGAGATRAAACESMEIDKPSLIKPEEYPPLERDFFEIASRFGAKDDYNKVKGALKEIYKDYSETLLQSLEGVTSIFYQKIQQNPADEGCRDNFHALLNLILRVLAKTTNDIEGIRFPLLGWLDHPLHQGIESPLYEFLRRILESEDKVSILSFNYDLLVEKTIDKICEKEEGVDIDFGFPGCYRLEIEKKDVRSVRGGINFQKINHKNEGVAILKLHGSVNWFSNHNSPIPTRDAMFKKTRQLYILNSTIIPDEKPDLKIGKKRGHAQPTIIPPVGDKASIIPNQMKPVWEDARKSLQTADRVIIVGYSCPPTDTEARILLGENIRKNTKAPSGLDLQVIDTSIETAAKYPDICGVNRVKIYRSIKEWINDPVNEPGKKQGKK